MSSSPEPAPARNVRATLSRGVARLETARVPSAPLAAELLLLHLLGRDRTWLYAHPDEIVGEGDLAEYDMLLKRRAEGVPVQYLTGEQEFWGLDFEVNPDVLIPRPETEHLIEVALERMGRRRNDPLLIADVGTGSGCIAVALAREFPASEIVATDISAAALEVAGRNTVRHGVQSRIELAQGYLLNPYLSIKVHADENFDLIVSNPPYVGRAEQSSLQREVVEHEPHQALFAGERGLDVYPELIAQAAPLLTPGGVLVLELGHGQSERVRAMVTEDGRWSVISVTNDLAGIPRVLAAERVST
jgi:release factor glutamine methyltransferase